MVMRKGMVEEFLSRDVDTFDWIKDVSEGDLDEVIADLDPSVKFYTDPRFHQKACFLLGIDEDNLLFFVDLGCGKSKIVLDIFSYRKQAGEANVGLVLVPNVVNIRGFEKECIKHTPHLSCVAMKGSSKTRMGLLEQEADLFVLNYAGLVALCTKRVGKGRRKKTIIDKVKIRLLRDKFDFVVLDESTAVRNHRSLTCRICRKFVLHCTYRYALTGTPIGKSPMAFWSQFYLIDKGVALGSTLGLYRLTFFSEKKKYWGGKEYTFGKKYKKVLRRFVKSRSIRYELGECYDMPGQEWMTVELDLPKDAATYYNEIVQGVIDAKRNLKIQKNSFVKLRQITSGFLTVTDDDKKIHIEFRGNPKLDALMQLCLELPLGRKMLVFHDYIYTGKRIGRALKALGFKYQRLWGGTKDPGASLDRFMEDPKYRIFVINNQAGSHGLNLQVANYTVFYESAVDPIVRMQTERRTYRDGQVHTCFYYDLVMSGTVDERLLDSIEEDVNLFKELLNGREDWSSLKYDME